MALTLGENETYFKRNVQAETFRFFGQNGIKKKYRGEEQEEEEKEENTNDTKEVQF